MKTFLTLFLITGIVNLSHAAFEITETEVIGQTQSTVKINLNSIRCTYKVGRPRSFERPLTHEIRIVSDVFKSDSPLDNIEMSLYGSDLVISFVKPLFNIPGVPIQTSTVKDCRVLAKLWAASPRGKIEVEMIQIVSRVTTTFLNNRCEQTIRSTKSFKLFGYTFSQTKQIFEHIKSTHPSNCKIIKMEDFSRVAIHLQAASSHGLQCETQWKDTKFVTELQLSTRVFGRTTITMDEEFENKEACEQEKTLISSLSKIDDPRNLGQQFNLTKSVEEDIAINLASAAGTNWTLPTVSKHEFRVLNYQVAVGIYGRIFKGKKTVFLEKTSK